MLQVFKRNDISAYIALLLVAIVCKIKYILTPRLFIIDAASFDGLFFRMNKLYNIYMHSPVRYIILSIGLQVIFAVFLNSVVTKQKLFPQKNYFTALSFILITSFLPSFNFLSSGFFSNVLLFTAFGFVMKLSSTAQPRKWCFNTGMLISIAAFFYFPAIIFLPVFIAFVWLLRPFVVQELLASLLGFITPVYFMLAVLYLRGNLDGALAFATGGNFHFVIPAYLSHTMPVLIFIFVSTLLLIYSLLILNKNAHKNAIIIRKKWRIVTVYLFFAVITGVFSRTFPAAYFLIALTPFSILLSQSFNNRNEKMNIFTLFFLMISLLCVQWVFLK